MAIQRESAELALGGRGVRGRRAGREGLRRRDACCAGGCGPRPTTCTTPRWPRPPPGAVFLPALELLPNVGLIAVLGFGGHRVIDGQITLGSFVLFNVFVVLLIWPMRMLGMIIANAPAGLGGRGAGRRGAGHRSGDRRPARTPVRSGPAAGEIRFEHVEFSYGDGSDPRAPRLRPPRRGRHLGGAGRGHGLRQDHRRAADPALLRRRSGRGASSTASTCGRCGSPTCAASIGIVFEETFLFSDSIAANIAFADPSASPAADRAGGPPRRRPRLHRRSRPRLRQRHRRAGLLALGRPASAHRHRPGHPRRSPGPDPRRRHQLGRPHQGARDPRRPGRGHGGPHHARHRPPARPPSPWPTASSSSTRAASWPRAPTTSCWRPTPGTARCWRPRPTTLPTAARRPPRRCPSDVDGGGVDEDDKLDRAAAGQVLRRSLRMLRPYRRQLVAGVGPGRGVHRHHAGRSAPRAHRHRRRHQGRRRGRPRPDRRRLRRGRLRWPTSSIASRS